MDLNKPATVKQVILIVWGPAAVAMLIWAIVLLSAAGGSRQRDDASFSKEVERRHQEGMAVLNATAGFVPPPERH